MRKTLIIPGGESPGIVVPYFEFGEGNNGPHLTVLAGIHGAEYSSIAAAKEFVKELTEEVVLGRLTVVPIVNILAFWERTPFLISVDQKNLNRAFPGNKNGTFTERYAFYIFENFIRRTDFLVDMHAGDIPESLEPFTIFEESEVESLSLDMARSYLIPHIIRQKATGLVVAGSTSAAAAAIGIPAIIAESGENGILDDTAVARHLKGIKNLALALGVLKEDGVVKGKVQSREHSEFRIYDGWNWLRADQAGWWSPAVETGADVAEGDLLGTLSDLWGDILAEIKSPQEGTVLFQTSSPAVSENGILVGLALR